MFPVEVESLSWAGPSPQSADRISPPIAARPITLRAFTKAVNTHRRPHGAAFSPDNNARAWKSVQYGLYYTASTDKCL